MEPTNMVRRIDYLGRIVIPKEIRKMFEWKEEDFIEIFIDVRDNTVTLKKVDIEDE